MEVVFVFFLDVKGWIGVRRVRGVFYEVSEYGRDKNLRRFWFLGVSFVCVDFES